MNIKYNLGCLNGTGGARATFLPDLLKAFFEIRFKSLENIGSKGDQIIQSGLDYPLHYGI